MVLLDTTQIKLEQQEMTAIKVKKNKNTSQLRIGVVGASIAGCAVTILLDRLGFDVKTFERRDSETMDDLGAGIVLPSDLVKELKNQHLFDQNFPAIPLNDRVFITNNDSNERIVSTIPMSALAINWSILYSQLAKRLPKSRVRYHAKATKVERNSETVILTINQEEKHEFDFVIFADGYRSLGRKFLFPSITPEFTDYTCWQGNFITSDKSIIEKIGNNAFYYLYEKGILLAYIIPSHDANTQGNLHTITWFLYETVDAKHPLCRDNKVHTNIYQDDMQSEYITYLHNLAIKYFPTLGQQIVTGTKKPFTHAIYDTTVPEYVKNKVVLIGDAGILLRPHLGSGATKALQDALNLSKHIQNCDDMDVALTSWGQERQKAAASLFDLSRAFGDFLVADAPKWNEIDGPTLNNLWNKICEGYNWYQNKS